MAINLIRQGKYKVVRDGNEITRHNELKDAIESLVNEQTEVCS